MYSYATLIALLLSSSLSHCAAVQPTTNVTLDAVTFTGAYSQTYNLTYYRRIPFGASTAGQNRFRAPQPPNQINGSTYDSDRAFDMCPQRTVNGSEDCLYLGVYSRPWSKPQSLRPVLLTFYGGGFIQGSASFSIPPSGFPVLNASTLNDYVVIYSNYRTNLFGFLAGSKIQKHASTDLNTGLLDQQAALLWIQKNIAAFGGDKTNVTIWGQSAGAGSVVAQTIATGNRGKKLFRKALDSSPYWPKTYRYDSAENEALFAKVVQAAGCQSSTDQVACLKATDIQTLRNISLQLSTSQQYTSSSYTWGPVVDDKFLTKSLSEVIKEGQLNADMVLSSYNSHEGENFIPPGFSSTAGSGGFNKSVASFDKWLQGFLPNFTTAQLNAVREQYPVNGATEELTWSATTQRAGVLYRDLILACPSYWLASTAKEGGYQIDYTISPAKHASDTIYWNQVNAVQKSDPLTYQGYTGAMASFIQTGDPNAHKLTAKSVVSVPAAREGQQFVIKSGSLAVEKIPYLRQRCDFWLTVAGSVPV